MADLNIQSFSQRALNYGTTTNFLYPSNSISKIAPIENPSPSIQQTISLLHLDILDYTEKGWLHSCGKPVRFVARLVYAKVVYTLIAPVGALYHFSATAGYSTQWVFVWLRGQENLPETAQKVQGHAWAFFTDSFYMGLGLWSCVLPAGGYLLYQDGAIAEIEVLKLALYSVLLSGEFWLYAQNPEASVFFERTKAQKDAFIESLFLRDKLGLVGKESPLLPVSPEDIETIDFRGTLGGTWMAESFKILDLIKEVNIELSQVAHHNQHIHFNSSSPCVIDTELTDILEALRVRRPLLKPKYYNDVLHRLTVLESRHTKLRNLLSDFFSNQSYDISVPQLPLPPAYCNNYVSAEKEEESAPPEQKPWDPNIFIRDLQEKDLPENYFRTKEYHEIYLAFKKALKAKKMPQQLLQLSPGFSQEDLNTVYRGWSRVLHPNHLIALRSRGINVTKEQETEIQALFSCLAEAKKRLEVN